MANLLGQNIGTNYKGILNLNTLNGNLSATLQAVTDGDGNTSPLNLATGSIQFGSTTGLFWDNANNRLGVGTNAPSRTLTITGDGARIRDLNIGVSSQTTIGNTSNIIMNIGSVGFGFTSGSALTAAAMVHVVGDGTNPIALFAGSGTVGNLVCFGGTTNAFPAIKRSGAGINFRVADDSGFCNIEAAQIKTGAGVFSSNTLFVSSGGGLFLGYGGGGGNLHLLPNGGTTSIAIVTSTGVNIGSGAINASARLQVDSTTQGFLPPRMTTAERDLISSPAAGLMIYNTSTNVLNFYNGSAWGAV
jgi:hypothetical protein